MITEKDLSNFDTMLGEIKTALLNDETIRKLLFYDTSDALSRIAPAISEVSDYVCLAPLTMSAILDFERNTYILINLATVNTDTESDDSKTLIGLDQIYSITTMKHWTLNNNKTRLIELSNRIIKIIDNVKFAPSGKAYVSSVEYKPIDDQLSGYLCKVLVVDAVKGT